jgi:hypothetical protein
MGRTATRTQDPAPTDAATLTDADLDALTRPDAPVTPDEGAPVTPDEGAGDAPDEPTREERELERAANDAPDDDAPEEGAGARRRREAREGAQKAQVSRYTLDEGAAWRPYGVDERTGAFIGEIAICRSTPNRDGHTFLYVVHRQRGREIAIPLLAMDALLDAGDREVARGRGGGGGAGAPPPRPE